MERIRIFKNKAFTRFAKKSHISDYDLCQAITNAQKGLIDADLGSGIIKQRLAREGEGKSGGFRSLIVFKMGTLAFFVYGFAKKEQDNISDDDLIALKMLAKKILNYNEEKLSIAIQKNLFVEVICDEQTI